MNSTQEIFPSSSFWAEIVLAKRQSLDRNQHQWKMLRMSKTKSSTFLEKDRFGLTPPFTVAWSEPGEDDGGVEAIWMSCEAGEKMCSREDMVVL